MTGFLEILLIRSISIKMNSQNGTIKKFRSHEVLMAPKKVIQRMENIVQKHGRERALKSGSFQKAREAWIVSVFMLGVSQKTGRIYWIRENEIPQDDPDIFSYSYRNPEESGEIGVVKEIQPIEVCEYPPQAKQRLADHIKIKLQNKYYHPETILICYIQRPGEAFKLIDIIKKLTDLQSTVREVWLLFHLAQNPASNFTIARVYLRGIGFPEMYLDYKGDYLELCKIPQPEFLRDNRGIDKIVKWEPSGELVVVPLPDDKTKKGKKRNDDFRAII